jgi:hypothetical protein
LRAAAQQNEGEATLAPRRAAATRHNLSRLLGGNVSEATPRGTTNISTALLSRRIRRYSQPVVEPTVGRTALERCS